MIRIANIVTDEKFIDSQIEYQDTTKDVCHHDYFYLKNKDFDGSFSYIKSKERIQVVSWLELLIKLKEKQYNAVFLHGLCSRFTKFVPFVYKGIKVFWFSWGYDFYSTDDSLICQMELYHEETNKALLQLENAEQKGIVLTVEKQIKKFLYRKSIKRVDYYSGVLPVEYDLIKNVAYFRALPVRYSYVNLKICDIKHEIKMGKGRNIIVGNSADPTNNHFDVIPYLNKLNLTDRKVYFPLNYAGEKKYISLLKNTINQSMSDNAVCLDTFMPFEQYKSLIESCSVGVFFHERQQALGNITMLIMNGCKIFLSETSVLYKYYKSIGVKVFSIQNELNQESLDVNLSFEEIHNNVKILGENRSKSNQISRLKKIYEII